MGFSNQRMDCRRGLGQSEEVRQACVLGQAVDFFGSIGLGDIDHGNLMYVTTSWRFAKRFCIM